LIGAVGAEAVAERSLEVSFDAARLTPDLLLVTVRRAVLAELAGLRGILPPLSVCGLPPALSYRRRSSHKSADLMRRHR